MKSKFKKIASIICAMAIVACMFALPTQAASTDYPWLYLDTSLYEQCYVGDTLDINFNYYSGYYNEFIHVDIYGPSGEFITALEEEVTNATAYDTYEITWDTTGYDSGNYTFSYWCEYYDNGWKRSPYYGSYTITLYEVLYGTWLHDGIGWYFAFEKGGYPYNTWFIVDGEYYYFNASGYMVTGWVNGGGTWYYLTPSGTMAKGWQLVDGRWYFFADSGAMVTGWQQVGGIWYYFNAGGDMATGWKQVGSTWYYFDGSGAMRTGWLNDGGTWYYFDGSGAMKTGWLNGGNTWYYLTPSGAMATGWQMVGPNWYYFYADGTMAVNAWIEGYWLGSDGVCL